MLGKAKSSLSMVGFNKLLLGGKIVNSSLLIPFCVLRSGTDLKVEGFLSSAKDKCWRQE